jgi:hypothetical protein
MELKMTLIPKNWASHQHYKNRLPPWIKLHRELLNDRDFMCLPLASKAIAPLLWLLASESETGQFSGDIQELSFRLRMTEKEIEEGLKPLINKGFFVGDSTVLADCQQLATPETERETETETEIDNSLEKFDIFWSAYPRKTAKGTAEKSWKKIKPDDQLLEEILAAVAKQKLTWTDPKFIPHPATWLNSKRWLDGVDSTAGKKLKYYEKGYQP